jgi:Ca-activated chloride channel homolog
MLHSRLFRAGLLQQMLFTALLTLLQSAAFAKSLTAPAEVDADSLVKIGLDGVDNERDFISIVKPDQPEGRYGEYEYTKGDSLELFAPAEPGDYEIRWLGAESPYPTIERQALKVLPIAATVQAPASAAIATEIKVQWEGPNHLQDFITIVPAATPERQYAETNTPTKVIRSHFPLPPHRALMKSVT